ncbi:MAG: hypothetical protein L0H31_09695, partial [Nocardioidaceae bacterium]|nr:hypothetical protein [Nocardioidaceae bacterium]
MSTLSAAGRLAWWGTSWMRGVIGADELLDGVVADDVTHVVLGTNASLLQALVDARKRGAYAVAASFPVAGDLGGLRGPGELNAAALEAGEVALLLGADEALIPNQVGRAVEWRLVGAARPMPPDLGEADRHLRASLLRAADALAALDVAS